MIYLFVYGTLLKKAGNMMATFLSEKSIYMGEGEMAGMLYKVDFFPGAIHDPAAESTVKGELYELHDAQKVLEVLDTYEGFNPEDVSNSLFVRKEVDIESEGQLWNAWVYLYNMPVNSHELIPSGDFLKYDVERY